MGLWNIHFYFTFIKAAKVLKSVKKRYIALAYTTNICVNPLILLIVYNTNKYFFDIQYLYVYISY